VLHRTGTGTATAQLWDLTAGAAIDTVTSTAAAPELKTATVALVAAHLVEVRVWTSGVAATDVAVLGQSYLDIEA
jgi:hypothetical protein